MNRTPTLVARALVAACAWLCGLAAWAQTPAPAPKVRTDLPAWYIFYASAQSPERSVYLIDARYQQVSDNVYQTQALVMRETPSGDFDHWSGILQYQATPEQVALARGPLDKLQPLLKTVKVRTVSAYQMQGSGKLVPGQPTDWTAFKSPIDLLGFRIATDPAALQRPEAYGMVFAGNFHRAIDVVDMVRKVLPRVKEIK